MVAAGVGRLCLLCRGVSMASGSASTRTLLLSPHGSCSFDLSSSRPCSEGRGMAGGREQPILAQAPTADTSGGDRCCHRLLTDKDLLPVIVLQV